MEGQVGAVDRALAATQWQALKATYERLGFPVHVLPADDDDLPDLVFTANTSFPVVTTDGRRAALLSAMRSPHRQPEVEVAHGWYDRHGWDTRAVDTSPALLEGMGDLRWHPGHRLLYGGYGFRTARPALEEVAQFAECAVVALRMVDHSFYHLDTCFSPLDARTALWVPDAFDADGRALLERCFPRLIEVDPREAHELLAANGHTPDGRHFLVHRGAEKTARAVTSAGFEPIALDVSEFLRSGGGIFCLTLMLP